VRFDHFLLTRFSYRRREKGGRGWHYTGDPLAPERLERRFKLFELFSSRSVKHQTNGRFQWIILVDPALDEAHRKRIIEVCQPFEQVRLVDFQEELAINKLGWLQPFISEHSTHVVTTNLDDDDLISTRYFEEIERRLREREQLGSLPSWVIMGARDFEEWDFLPTREAPLGYVKPWHRTRWLTSVGFTLCCKYPEIDLSVLGLRHRFVDAYCDPLHDPGSEKGRPPDRALEHLRARAQACGEDWRSWSANDRIVTLTEPCRVVVLNHIANDQVTRLFEASELRRPIKGPEDLPDVPVDFARVRASIGDFACGSGTLASLLARSSRVLWSNHQKPVSQRIKESWPLVQLPIWYARGLFRSRSPWQ
jgi:hypothetical protein